MSVIDGTKLEFEWKTASAPMAKITGGPRHWELVAVVFDAGKTIPPGADGNETPWPIPQNAIVINASFEGHKYGSAEILSPSASIEDYEKLIRESPDVIENAINGAHGNLRGHVSNALWKLGIGPEAQ